MVLFMNLSFCFLILAVSVPNDVLARLFVTLSVVCFYLADHRYGELKNRIKKLEGKSDAE